MRVRMGTRASALAVTAASLVAVAGCATSGTSGAAQADGGRVSIAIPEPHSLVPTNADETAGSGIDSGLFTGLVTYDRKDAPVLTGLARSITTQDRRHWRIRLNSGWTFHNGEPVTTHSFVDAWNYGALATNGQYASSYYSLIDGYDRVAPVDAKGNPGHPTAKALRGLKVVDDTTFTVTLTQPDNTFLSQLAFNAFYPLPKVAFTDPKAFAQKPIGDGPFQLRQWQHNSSVSLDRYGAYKGEKPHLAGIDYRIYQDMGTAYNDLRSGALDITTSLPETAYQDRAELGSRYQAFPSSYFAFIGLPTFDPSLGDVRIRKAISMSIDRAAITKVVFHGTRTPADAFVGPSAPGYRPGSCGATCTYDPTAARALFDQAGGPSKLKTLRISYNADGPHKEWVDAACNSIANTLQIQCLGTPSPDFPTLMNKMGNAAKTRSPFGAFRLAVTLDYPVVEDYLTPLYSSTGGSNLVGYRNPKVDQLLVRGRAASTSVEAQRLWAQAEDLVAADVPVVPLFFGETVTVRSARVQGLYVDPFEHVDLTALHVTS